MRVGCFSFILEDIEMYPMIMLVCFVILFILPLSSLKHENLWKYRESRVGSLGLFIYHLFNYL